MRGKWYFLLSIGLLLTGACGRAVPAPEAKGNASPEGVDLSLSTVDPEKSLNLFDYDQDAPLDVQEVKRWEESEGTWIDLSYASLKGGRVPARMVIPDGRGPFAGIILQHGGLGNYEQLTPLARELSGLGVVVFMMNDPYSRPGGWAPTQYMGQTWPYFTEQDLAVKIQLILDLRRAIDLLEARPEVDPDRLAYYGLSFGAAMGGLLAGVEDRLVAYVLQVGDGGLVEHTSDPGTDGLPVHFSPGWAETMWPTESLHFIGRAAPAALLFMSGTQDVNVPPRDAIRYQTAASEPKTVVWFEADHYLTPEATMVAARWLQPYLGERLLWLAPYYRSSAVWLDRIYSAWVAVVLLSGTYMLLGLKRSRTVAWGEAVLWMLASLLFGPLSLVMYRLAMDTWPHARSGSVDLGQWHRSLGIAVLSASGFAVGSILAVLLAVVLPEVPVLVNLGLQYGIPLVTFLILMRVLARELEIRGWVKLLAANVLWGATIVIANWLAAMWGVNINLHPMLWWVFSVTGIAGVLLLTLLYRWSIDRGLLQWKGPGAEKERIEPGRSLGRPVAAGLTVLGYVGVLVSLLVVIAQEAGLTFLETIKALVGLL